mgnify:CR=1 FL=1
MMVEHQHIWMYERPINGIVYKHCRLCGRRVKE